MGQACDLGLYETLPCTPLNVANDSNWAKFSQEILI